MAIYLDYNSTTPIDPRVLDRMIDVYKNHPGNADSRTHDFGEDARKIVEQARGEVATLLGVKSDEIFFTSGATESNNLAILGLREYAESTGKKHIITTSIEHHSVLNVLKFMEEQGFDITYVDPDQSGRVNAKKVLSYVRGDTLLVSVMHVNNETGIIQPVEEIGEALNRIGVLFHVDATQSCGKLVEEIRNLKYDMLSLSAHKFRGPQGIGALVLRRKNYKLPPVKPIMFGGQQEHNIRPGTTPVALVAGMGLACKYATDEYKQIRESNIIIKNEILKILDDSKLHYEINGDLNFCIENTINIYIDGVVSEALMLSTKQYCALSNGSACTSKSYSPSYVLKAMRIPINKIENSVRISWGDAISLSNISPNFKQIIATAKMLAV